MPTVPERLSHMRTCLSNHAEHITLLESTLHMSQVLPTLEQYAKDYDAAATAEDQTDDARSAVGIAVREGYLAIAEHLHMLSGLLHWHIGTTQPAVYAELEQLPSSRRADERAQILLDFCTKHSAVITHGDVIVEIDRLRQILADYLAARTQLPAVETAEDKADVALQTAYRAADLYLDCLERVLRRLFVNDLELLYEYKLRKRPVATPSA